MDDSEALGMMRVALGTLARVHALEHTVFALMASHPYPEVALKTWDASLPSWTDGLFQYSDTPEVAEVFRKASARQRETLATAAEQMAKR